MKLMCDILDVHLDFAWLLWVALSEMRISTRSAGIQRLGPGRATSGVVQTQDLDEIRANVRGERGHRAQT